MLPDCDFLKIVSDEVRIYTLIKRVSISDQYFQSTTYLSPKGISINSHRQKPGCMDKYYESTPKGLNVKSWLAYI